MDKALKNVAAEAVALKVARHEVKAIRAEVVEAMDIMDVVAEETSKRQPGVLMTSATTVKE